MPEEAVASPDESQDNLGDDPGLETDDLKKGEPEGDVEVEDEQEAKEELDERGVPWKNRAA